MARASGLTPDREVVTASCVQHLPESHPQPARALPYDDVRVEDVDSDAEDHAYDALRYGLALERQSRENFDTGVVRTIWR